MFMHIKSKISEVTVICAYAVVCVWWSSVKVKKVEKTTSFRFEYVAVEFELAPGSDKQ